ncbi:MAG: sulfur carrier protein ThiS [Nitrospinota bacterium]|nr:sulfur carrier protein ThiS [Nitrospinota bacterium]
MEIILNGQPSQTPDGESLADLIKRLGLEGPLASMVNGEIIHRDKVDAVRLNPGDQVELFRMMGGG